MHLAQAGLSVEVLAQGGTEPFTAVAQQEHIHVTYIAEM